MQRTQDDNPVVDILITEGYAFRLSLVIFQLATEQVDFKLSDRRISIVHSNKSKSCLLKLVVDTNDILRYRFEHDKDTNLLVTLDIKEFLKAIGKIHKKNGLHMYINRSSIDNMYVCSTAPGSSMSSSSADVVNVRDSGYQEYDFPTFAREPNDPNVRLSAASWGSFCKNVLKTGCTHAIIFVYPRGVLMVGVSSDKKAVHRDPHGEGVPHISEAEALLARVYGNQSSPPYGHNPVSPLYGHNPAPPPYGNQSSPPYGYIPALPPAYEHNSPTYRDPPSPQRTVRLEIVDSEPVGSRVIVPYSPPTHSEPPLQYIRIPQNFLKALSKIDGISSSLGIIRFFFQEDKGSVMMKMDFKLACCGSFTVFMKDVQI